MEWHRHASFVHIENAQERNSPMKKTDAPPGR
jgi:hypothetical protein